MSELNNSLPMPPGTGPGANLMPAPDPGIEDLLCLHGPTGACKHLWQFQTNFRSGNPEGTPNDFKHNRYICTCGTEEMDLAAGAVYSCNRYTPGGAKLVQLTKKNSEETP